MGNRLVRPRLLPHPLNKSTKLTVAIGDVDLNGGDSVGALIVFRALTQ